MLCIYIELHCTYTVYTNNRCVVYCLLYILVQSQILHLTLHEETRYQFKKYILFQVMECHKGDIMKWIYSIFRYGNYITVLLADCITWSFCPPVSIVKDAMESIYSIVQPLLAPWPHFVVSYLISHGASPPISWSWWYIHHPSPGHAWWYTTPSPGHGATPPHLGPCASQLLPLLGVSLFTLIFHHQLHTMSDNHQVPLAVITCRVQQPYRLNWLMTPQQQIASNRRKIIVVTFKIW